MRDPGSSCRASMAILGAIGFAFVAAPGTADAGFVVTVVMSGLDNPRGLAFGPDGSLYVSNRGTSAGGGEVLRITAVPEPASLAAFGLGLAVLAGLASRLRSVASR